MKRFLLSTLCVVCFAYSGVTAQVPQCTKQFQVSGPINRVLENMDTGRVIFIELKNVQEHLQVFPPSKRLNAVLGRARKGTRVVVSGMVCNGIHFVDTVRRAR